jgi:hypothetical protein
MACEEESQAPEESQHTSLEEPRQIRIAAE